MKVREDWLFFFFLGGGGGGGVYGAGVSGFFLL